jgi:hypothetical protein
MIEDRQTITSMIRRLKESEKRLNDYYNQHKKLKRSVNQRMDRLEDDVDELFAMEVRDCNCSKKSINSSSEESDLDYALPEKQVHNVNPDKVMCVKKKSGNKKVKPSSCKSRRN